MAREKSGMEEMNKSEWKSWMLVPPSDGHALLIVLNT